MPVQVQPEQEVIFHVFESKKKKKRLTTDFRTKISSDQH